MSWKREMREEDGKQFAASEEQMYEDWMQMGEPMGSFQTFLFAEYQKVQALDEKFRFLVTGVHQGRLHLETQFGPFENILQQCDLESKDFMFGHITGMMEMLRHMLEEEDLGPEGEEE